MVHRQALKKLMHVEKKYFPEMRWEREGIEWTKNTDMLLQLILSSEPLVSETFWEASKTIFIDSGEAYFCLVHCLYIGQQ